MTRHFIHKALCSALCTSLLLFSRLSMASVTMNFANTDISQVAHAIGAATGKTIIVDPRVKGLINLTSENPVSEEVAIKTLQSALRMQGFSLLQDHGVIKIVPEADAKVQGVATYVGNQPVASGDQVVTQVFQLHRASANTIVPIIRPLISPNNTVSAYPGNNTIIVTDYADNIRRIASVIAGIDAASAPHIDVVQLNFADAASIVPQIQKLLDLSAIGESDPTQKVTVAADPRTNSIVLRSSEPARIKEAESLVIKFDTPARTPGNIHIVTLRNADATEVAKTLRSILGQSGGDSKEDSTQSKGSGQNSSKLSDSSGSLPPLPSSGGSTGSSSSSTAAAASGASSVMGGASSSSSWNSGDQDGDKGNGEIVADVSTNSVIITASEPVFQNLSTVIARLDQRKVQVYIESLIMEVSSDKEGQFGIQWLTTAGLESLAASTTSVGIVAGFGNILGTKGIFQALQTSSDVNILSTPSLVTLDNHEARILVGTNIPIETGTYSTASTSSSSASAFNTYDRTDVGIMLDVKPQINQGGTIKLQLYQEDSSVISGSADNAGGSSINKRSLQSTILADDGQIVVLGGLISDSYTNGNSRLPWISKVPLLGYLFRNETKSRQKTNLLIFLRPVIVKDAATLKDISSDRYDYVRGKSKDYKTENWSEKYDTVPIPPQDNGNPSNGAPDVFDVRHMEHKVTTNAQ